MTKNHITKMRAIKDPDMSLQQIGETVNKLSDELLSKYNNIEWDAVIGFRNIVTHKYEWVDINRVWMIICEDVPTLKKYCEIMLREMS